MLLNIETVYRWFIRRIPRERRLPLYPPLRAMGVTVLEMDPGFRHARFLLPLTWRSRNMGGNMFGGNQASLADPIAALACVHRFPGHDAFTRKLEVDFRAPGDSDLELHFHFPETLEQQIRMELESKGRANPRFEYAYFTRDGVECTRVFCEVAIRPEHYLSQRQRTANKDKK